MEVITISQAILPEDKKHLPEVVDSPPPWCKECKWPQKYYYPVLIPGSQSGGLDGSQKLSIPE